MMILGGWVFLMSEVALCRRASVHSLSALSLINEKFLVSFADPQVSGASDEREQGRRTPDQLAARRVTRGQWFLMSEVPM